MAGTRTTKFKIYKSEVGAEADGWGGRTNEGWNDVDALLGATATTGSANAYLLASGLTTALSAYVTGQTFLIIPNFTNSGAATLNVDSLGAKNITKNGTTALASGDLVSGQIYRVAYDGTQFQVLRALSGAFQALDATLTALAALSFSGSSIIRATGSDTFVVQAFATDAETRALASTTAPLTPSNLAARALFRAHKNGTDQTGISGGTPTKATLGTETHDVGAYFDTTNSRWIPPAGPIRVSGAIYFANVSSQAYASIYKNGSLLANGNLVGQFSGIARSTVEVCDIANGTDYYELFGIADTATTVTFTGTATMTYFCGEQV